MVVTRILTGETDVDEFARVGVRALGAAGREVLLGIRGRTERWVIGDVGTEFRGPRLGGARGEVA